MSSFHRHSATALIASPFFIAFSGCYALSQNGWVAPPGPMNYQQANAIVHDPFPQGDIGPEDLASRPPDYQNPLPLPVRNQMKTEIAPWLGP